MTAIANMYVFIIFIVVLFSLLFHCKIMLRVGCCVVVVVVVLLLLFVLVVVVFVCSCCCCFCFMLLFV